MTGIRGLAPALVLSLLIGVLGGAAPDARAAETKACRAKPTSADQARISRVRPDRPRLLVDTLGFEQARLFTENRAAPKRWRAQLREAAEARVGAEPTTYVKRSGRLQFSEYKNRVLLLAYAYRMEGDRRYRRQARKELLAAARFRDWNPGHYLDVAEMTAATAIAYDWIYDGISERDRRTIRTAILEKGLRTSLCRYAKPPSAFTRRDNWGIVTNAGMALGALAVAEHHPRVAGAVLGASIRSVRGAFGTFAPDGAWPEGPTYWRYATEHAVKMVAALETATGSSEGLADAPGFSTTGAFARHSIGPTGLAASFSDSDTNIGRAPHLFWLARRFARPVDAGLRFPAVGDKPTVWDVLWFTPERSSPASAGMPPSEHYRRLSTAFLRSRWGSRYATYVALKGGSNAAGHAHPELGAFIVDMGRKRWALDLGRDSYSLPGYFSRKKRRHYYRLSAGGQNTLLVGGAGQLDTGTATTTLFRAGDDTGETVLDLSRAYDRARTVRRGVAMAEGSVLIQDEVTADKVRSVRWAMHTKAAVDISADGRTAVLTRGRRQLTVRILTGTNIPARFVAVSAERSPPESTNAGVTRLEIRTRTVQRSSELSSLRLAVALQLDPSSEPRVRPLSRW